MRPQPKLAKQAHCHHHLRLYHYLLQLQPSILRTEHKTMFLKTTHPLFNVISKLHVVGSFLEFLVKEQITSDCVTQV
jgi:hypothetical protein